jgi:hypothetical protein
MKRAVFLIALVCSALWAACDGIVGGDDDNFAFDSIRVAFDSAMVDNAEGLALLRGNLQIDGLIILPHPCHTIDAEYERFGGQLTLVVHATPTNTTCTGELTAMQYRLQTFGMPGGPYRLRVYHQIGTATRTLIAEQNLTIG